ncbi:MAG: hypothetical protein Kow0090_15070 [Myxococcota bacterium]
MSKFAEIRGIIAVSLSDGRNLGKIKRVLIDRKKRFIWGFTLSHGGIFAEEFLLPTNRLEKLGEDFLLVKSGEGLIEFDSHEAKKTLPPDVSILNEMIGFDVATSRGKHLGNLLDIEIETKKWSITGLYLSGGRLARGLSDDAVFGDDVIILPPDAPIEEVAPASGQESKRGGILALTIGKEGFHEIAQAVERIVKQKIVEKPTREDEGGEAEAKVPNVEKDEDRDRD